MDTTSTSTDAPAYDYDAQQWIDAGPAAAALRRRQLAEALELIEGPRGAEYLRFIGDARPPAVVAQSIRAKLATT